MPASQASPAAHMPPPPADHAAWEAAAEHGEGDSFGQLVQELQACVSDRQHLSGRLPNVARLHVRALHVQAGARADVVPNTALPCCCMHPFSNS